MSARILEVTAADYHSDPCETPSLSSSIAHTLITRSPLHAWTAHPRLGGIDRQSTKAMDQGSLVHALLLGKGNEFQVLSFDNYRTKEAKEARDNALAEGAIPVLEHEHDAISSIAGELKQRIADEGVDLDDGEPEVAIEWREPIDGGSVLCRRMIDLLNLDKGIIIELKTIRSADADTCSRQAYSLGYDLGLVATLCAVNELKPELAGRIIFKHVFLEKSPSNEKPMFKPPYIVVVREHDAMFEELGFRRWARATKMWERCIRTNQWPGYPDAPLTIPGWAMAAEESEIE